MIKNREWVMFKNEWMVGISCRIFVKFIVIGFLVLVVGGFFLLFILCNVVVVV